MCFNHANERLSLSLILRLDALRQIAQIQPALLGLLQRFLRLLLKIRKFRQLHKVAGVSLDILINLSDLFIQFFNPRVDRLISRCSLKLMRSSLCFSRRGAACCICTR